MKKLTAAAMSLLITVSAAACGMSEDVSSVSGVYTLKDVDSSVPKDFTITIYEDGTFQSYETPVSSYIGMGHYSIEDNILTLVEDAPGCSGDINYYRIEDGSLLFISDDSENYHFFTLEDGAVFERTSDVI